MNNIRRPAVAGLFYPKDREDLRETLSGICKEINTFSYKPYAILSPHAGYVYSGKIACKVYSCAVSDFEKFIILGPNHRSVGHPLALYNGDEWETPLGFVSVNREISEEIVSHPLFSYDNMAHSYEHSIEVQLPFLQYLLGKNISIVPICVGDIGYSEAVEAGHFLAEIIKDKNYLIVISSDMSHYVPEETAKKNDEILIKAMESLNTEELYVKAMTYGISMCGLLPAVIGIEASKKLGAEKGILIDYGTSGDTTGDYESVVGYCGMVFI